MMETFDSPCVLQISLGTFVKLRGVKWPGRVAVPFELLHCTLDSAQQPYCTSAVFQYHHVRNVKVLAIGFQFSSKCRTNTARSSLELHL